jgi:shikimate kinase
MAQHKIVYIIGFMGSGKTTAGRKVSGLLGWDFIDLDEEITHIEGRPIRNIFSESGEQYFRSIESETLRKLEIRDNAVISVGGGAPCTPGNLDFMKEKGLVVYLKKTPRQLVSRLSRDPGKRPLLRDVPEGGLLKYISEKLSEREHYYNKADLLITGMDIDISKLALDISRACRG